MERYQNHNGDSGIVAYEILEQAIIVQFKNGGKYLYSYASAGSDCIEQMKKLALKGRGLNTFITLNAHHKYERKLA
jgi:hypothetical protein